MDHRQDTRFPFTIEARITELSTNQTSNGPVVNISRSGMAARLPFQFQPNDVVRIELDGVTVYGHVIHVGEEAPYLTGFEIEKVLLGNSDLTALLNSLLQPQPAPQIPSEDRQSAHTQALAG